MNQPVLGVNEQLARILDEVRPLQPIEVRLSEARGLVLAESVHARWPLPPFDTAEVNGFAVRAADVASASPASPCQLRVIDDIAGGRASRQRVSPGTAVRIARGSVMPVGADAVVPFTSTLGVSPHALVTAPVTSGQHVRVTGSAESAGNVLLTQGIRVTPLSVGVAAAAGRGSLVVHPSPRVVVIVCGSELVAPGAPPGATTLTDQTGPLLTAGFAQLGATPTRIGPLPDDPRVIADAITDQLTSADLIITTGGIGRGPYDVVAPMMRQATGRDISEVAMRPGGRLGFGWLGGVPIVNLPGDPVEAALMAEVFAGALLRRMMGHRQVQRTMLQATTATTLEPLGHAQKFIAGSLRDGERGVVFHPVRHEGGLTLTSLARADGFAVLSAGGALITAGSLVRVLPLGPTNT